MTAARSVSAFPVCLLEIAPDWNCTSSGGFCYPVTIRRTTATISPANTATRTSRRKCSIRLSSFRRTRPRKIHIQIAAAFQADPRPHSHHLIAGSCQKVWPFSFSTRRRIRRSPYFFCFTRNKSRTAKSGSSPIIQFHILPTVIIGCFNGRPNA